jgi:hypothetical protein
VVRFWRAVELFSPQQVPGLDPRKRVYPVRSAEPLPWEAGHPLRRVTRKPRLTWRHVVYGGVYSLDRVHALLERAFGRDDESFDERSRGETALFAFTATDEGRPLLGSQVFSSCAWAAGRTLDPGPEDSRWLDGFEAAASGLNLEFEKLAAAAEDDQRAAELRAKKHLVGRPLDAADLADLAALVAERFGVTDLLEATELRISSVQVSERREFAVDGQDFLNSFLVEDLGLVAKSVARGDRGPALETYLREDEQIDPSRRVDLRQESWLVFDTVKPDWVPLGRWPAKVTQPLALSQQFAVDTAIAELGAGAGVFAVNGPPGTGKTTMLRDLVAAIVVERARRLAELDDPQDAFGAERRWKTGDYTRVVSTWSEDLTGFEIVLASANNGAVENVTLEIPASRAIDEDWSGAADYFSGLATRVLGEAAWGLVAARLGNKANRQDFVSAFWFPERDPKTGAIVRPGLLDVLKEYERDTSDWPAAVAAFRGALQEAGDEQKRRAQAYAALRAVPAAAAACEQARRALAVAEEQLARARAHVAEAEQALASAEREVHARTEKRLAHRQFRPGFVEALFTLGRAVRAWRAEDGTLAEAVEEAEHRLAAAGNRAESSRAAQAEAADALNQRHRALDSAQVTLASWEDELAQARRSWGGFVPGEQWWTDEQHRELATPWTDPDWNQARTRLFLAALRLHQAFLRANATQMRRSLQGAMDILQGTAPAGMSEDAARAAWQSLFFVVPVVSTTFASFGRVFAHLGRESLGWLFIDEAGQATPQAAAGAIWRSRRVVVVGDPLQLEPVVTIPFTAQQALRRHFQATEKWLPGRTSVQRLADQANVYGTYLPSDDGKVWVGAPLRVHRRCIEPMFGISNTIAYDGLMVYGTGQPAELPLPPSMWIDVVAEDADGHWIPEEGRAAQRLLGALQDRGVDMANIFAIAPFRDVANQLRRLAADFGDFPAGTIHTAQGKEAIAVLLVLGGNPRSPGAKAWAARKPNLLNVAASRAKRRLYVIGNRNAWCRYRHFDTLADRLPPYPW